MRCDSFFSDRPQFELNSRKTAGYKSNQRGSFPGNADVIQEDHQLVLQREPFQSGILSSSILFGLTIVCLVLGVVSNVYTEGQPNQHVVTTGQTLKGAVNVDAAMY